VTGEDSSWDELWEQLKEFFGVLADQLRERNPSLGTLPSHFMSTAFPFSGYLSLARRAPSLDEDLVLCWRVAWREGRLTSAADIARGDGTVLAQTPPVDIADPVHRPDLAAELDRAIGFFRDNLQLIMQEVC
jgi:hypothetical protein